MVIFLSEKKIIELYESMIQWVELKNWIIAQIGLLN